jgi:putative ABC transport system permease protein
MWWSTLLIAIREIRRNAMRSALTILGVVIGVAAVITMVTLGAGASSKITAEISSLGENLLIISPGRVQRGPGGTSSLGTPFTLRDVEALEREIGNVQAIAPYANKYVLAVSGSANRSTNLVGTENSYFLAANWTIERGRTFTDNELRGGRSVCIVGATVAADLFGSSDPIGRNIRIATVTCTIVALLASKGQSMGGNDQDDLIVMPLKTFQRRIAGDSNVGTLFVSARDSSVTEKVRADIEALLRQRRPPVGSKDDFQVTDLKEIASTVARTTGVLTAMLAAVAGISLLVGGIGIMNIMLVSVTERTREIGIRLAVGARGVEVMLQFLVEAVALSCFGGLIGVVLGLTGSAAAARFLEIPFTPDIRVIVVAFVFSAAVGVTFGFFPARKAAALDPIDALRHE